MLVRQLIVLCLTVGLAFPVGIPSSASAQSSKPRVAVVSFVSDGVNSGTIDFLYEFLRQELDDSFEIDLAPESETASGVQSIGAAGKDCFEPTCAQAIGAIVGVDRVVTGKASKARDLFSLELRAVEVSTGTEIYRTTVKAATEDGLFVYLGERIGEVSDALGAAVPADARDTATASPDPIVAATSAGDGIPKLEHERVVETARGVPLSIETSVRGELGDFEIFVMFRVPGEPRLRYTQMQSLGNRRYGSQIPGTAVGESGVDYFLRLVDSEGSERGRYPAGLEFIHVRTRVGSDVPGSNGTRGSTSSSGMDSGGAAAGEGAGSKRWWIVGAIAAAVGATVLLVGGGGGDGGTDPVEPPADDTLPTPPEHQ